MFDWATVMISLFCVGSCVVSYIAIRKAETAWAKVQPLTEFQLQNLLALDQRFKALEKSTDGSLTKFSDNFANMRDAFERIVKRHETVQGREAAKARKKNGGTGSASYTAAEIREFASRGEVPPGYYGDSD